MTIFVGTQLDDIHKVTEASSAASVLGTESSPLSLSVSKTNCWMTIMATALFGSRSFKSDQKGNVVEDYEDDIREECPALQCPALHKGSRSWTESIYTHLW